MSSNDALRVGARPTSATQYAALESGALPAPELIADGVWAIAAPMPPGKLTHTLSYVLVDADARVHIIDPGWDSHENLAALEQSLTHIGVGLANLTTMIATHHHPDHLAIAERLRALTGASIVLSRAEREVLAHQVSDVFRNEEAYTHKVAGWGVPESERADLIAAFSHIVYFSDVEPDRVVEHGDVVQLGSFRLRVMVTPGHTGGHVCLIDDERLLVYSGDHVLPQIYGGIGLGSLPGDLPLDDYLSSLEALNPFDEYQVLPGHEYRFEGLAARTHQIGVHHMRRTRAIVGLLDELGDAPMWEYAKRLTWTGGWANMRGFLLHSALMQTEMHYNLVRSGKAGPALERYPEPS